ncbi:MAG: DNA-binding response OmpR family regulator [Ulvibacter sp.]|jgi:DNA-binding response OmpR family regulator
MLVLDGIEASKRIREDHLHKNKPIISIVANADDKSKSICLANGMDDFLAKPYSISDLVNRIKVSLGQEILSGNGQSKELTDEREDFQNKSIEIFIQESDLRPIKLKEALINKEFETITGICQSRRLSLIH